MKVLIDNQIYEGQKFGGISRYFNELRLGNNLIQKMEEFVDVSPKDSSIRTKIKNKLNKVPFYRPETQINKYEFYSSQLETLQFDVFHPTYYDNYFLPHLKKPFVLTVHDMIHEKYAEYFNDSLDSINKRRLCERANKVIAISETTKKDLIDIFDVPEEKIEVIYHGTSFTNTEAIKPLLNIQDRPYILFTGNRNIYKNFLTFLIAVSPILKERKDLLLICSGPSFNSLEKRWINDLGVSEHVKNYFCENDNELVYLYQHAECFVFPSLYEGFGFPVLEAFATNCPLISSNTGALKEIAKDAAIYFNPKDIGEMRQAIINVISDDTLKKELVQAGKNRLTNFSWEKCRKETNLLYSKVL